LLLLGFALTVPAASAETALVFEPSQTQIHWTLDTVFHTVHGTFQLRGGTLRFDPATGRAAAQWDRSVQLAVAAAEEAMADAGATVAAERAAVVTGSALGGKTSENETYRQLYAEKRTRFDPLTIPRLMANGSASWISMRYGITGPCYTVSTACASKRRSRIPSPSAG
jgi:3-oxoacyl-(acyl-carrier-protein) synthase